KRSIRPSVTRIPAGLLRAVTFPDCATPHLAWSTLMRYRILVVSAVFSMLAWAQEPQVIPIWPADKLAADAATQHEVITETAAHDHSVTNIHNPTITAYLPPADKATGAAIVIAPGGAHRFLTMDREGYDVAKWMASIGVA